MLPKYQDLKAKIFKKPKVAEEIDDSYETLESCQNKYGEIKERLSNLSLQSLELLDQIQNHKVEIDKQKIEVEMSPKYDFTRFIEEAIENPELLRGDNFEDVLKPIGILFAEVKKEKPSEYVSFDFNTKLPNLRAKILKEDYVADQIQIKIDAIKLEIEKDKSKVNNRFGGKNAQKRVDQNYIKLDELNKQFESSIAKITQYANNVLILAQIAQSIIEK